VTKIMTAYVTLKAVKEEPLARYAADSVAGRSLAVAVQDGLSPGIQVTVDNALKMMMVKSANDMAVVLAEAAADRSTASRR